MMHFGIGCRIEGSDCASEFLQLFLRNGQVQKNDNHESPCIDILPALKREDSHGTAPLGWDGYGL